MNILGKIASGIALVSLITSQANAQSSDDSIPTTLKNGFYISLGEVTLDEKIAFQEGVEDSAFYFRLAWEGQSDKLVYGAGLSGYVYSDNEGFNQLVEDLGGDVSSEDSSAVAINLFFEGGYSHTVNNALSFEAIGGFEPTISSERSIGNCTDCYSEDIDIGGGLYFSPRVRFGGENTFSFLLAYHQYLTGEVENGLTASFSWRF